MRNLILLHGALGHSDSFIPYEEWLASHFRVHKITFEGHGEAPIPDAALSIEMYTEQLHQYIHLHNLQQADIFGYSMGGYIALWYSIRYPGVLTSILTLATKLNWTEEGALKESRLLIPETIKAKVPKYADQLAAIHGEDKWGKLVQGIAGLMVQLGKKPLLYEENLKLIDIPVQLMTGDKDKMTSVSETCTAAALIPNAYLAILPDTGHPFEQVRPALLTSLMKDFWKLY